MSGAAAGSPPGSPVGQLDGAAIAMQMIGATTAAADAARAAAEAVEGMKSSMASSSSTDEKAWYRLLPKPGCFDPTSREDEIAKWRDWSWSFEQYIGTLDPQFVTELERIRRTPDVEVDMSIMTGDEQKRCIFLYSLLASVLKNRPLMLLKSVKSFNGYECYRQLVASNEPQNKNRSLSLLNAIMSWPSFSNKYSLMTQIMKLEAAFSEYEKLGSALAEEIRSAVLMRCLVGQIKTFLQLQITDSTSYLQIREAVLSYERSTTKWSETMVLGLAGSPSNGDDPMEVDRIKGKGKEKGKHKSKGKHDAKGKGKAEKGKPSWNNGKGSSQWDNGKGQQWNPSNHSQTKGSPWQSTDYNNKGKGKSKDKGKGKSNSETCFRCGKPGHRAKDCRVRLVGDNSGAEGSNSTQHRDDQSTTTAASTTQHVKRVVFTDPSIPPLDLPHADTYFDISSEFHDPVVRMICSEAVEPELRECPNLSGNGATREYSFGYSGDGIAMYSLGDLFGIDDCNHYIDMVSKRFNFDLYDFEVQSRSSFKRSLSCQLFCPSMQCKRLQSSSDFAPSGNELTVRALTIGHDIVVDSGSDATVLPLHMSGAGTPSCIQDSALRDAQGNPIHVSTVRDICFDLETEDGQVITIRDKAHFSSAVDSPIISYGKLLKKGWGISPDTTGSFLTHARGFRIPMNFRNNSLTIHGHVRVISTPASETGVVRAIQVDVPRSWNGLGNGWWDISDDMIICVSGAQTYQDVTNHVSVIEWPYRTSVAFHDADGWCVLELCEKVFDMENRSKPLGFPYRKLLTILTKSVMNTEQLGMVVHESPAQRSSPSSGSGRGAGGAISSDAGQLTSSDQPMTVTSERAPVTRDSSTAVLPVVAERPSVTIAGIQVFPDSSIAVLAATCKYLEISQSGSKTKLWNRICSHLDKLKILEEVEISNESATLSQRAPIAVQTSEKPADEEVVKLHNLTHIPYAAWCESCVRAKGKPDRHEQDQGRLMGRELPSLSFDFFYTGRSCEPEQEDSESAKLTALVLYDSFSSAVHCIPVHSKAQRKHMVAECVKFLQFLGHADVCLRCDQEPAILAVQNLLQRTWQRLGHRVVIENSKLLDHASNAWVEKAVDNVRSMSSVLQHEVSKRLNHDIPVGHPLFAWSFIHGCWLRNRFTVKAGATSYELIRGHAYRGKLCQFAEPIMCFVGDTTLHKGDPKWRPGIFLTKNVTNDMFLVHCEGSLRLTRSVKSMFSEWSEHMALYRSIRTFPWELQGVLGNRIEPTSKSYLGVATAIPGLDDEAGDDPDDLEVQAGEGGFLTEQQRTPVTPLIPISTPTPATVGSSVSPECVPILESGSASTGMQPARMMPPPPSAALATTDEAGRMDTSSGTRVAETALEGEPSSKRPRTVRRIGDEELEHVDMEMDEYESTFDWEPDSALDSGDEAAHDLELTDECIWQPFTELEPVLGADELLKIDSFCDKLELERLTGMGVLTTQQGFSGECGKTLSTKFVRSWRKKTRKVLDETGKVVAEEPAWMRRSRLVAREFNWLESREDTFSPATNAAVVKLLPALCMSDGFTDGAVMGTLDISDAFLQVPQLVPRIVTINGVGYVILKCLPGQRDASRLWFNFFVSSVQKHVDAVQCAEQPCVLRVGRLGAFLIHVDDILFMGNEQWLRTTFLPKLQQEFKLTYTIVPRQEGGSFEFLKRFHEISPGYTSLIVYPETKHVCTLFERFCSLNGKPPKLAKTPCVSSPSYSPSDSQPLSDHLSSEYRSLVGIILYLCQERFDIQFAAKTLATSLKAPTQSSWQELGRCIGYLKYSEDFALKMDACKKGCTFMESILGVQGERTKNMLEVFTDSDWSGSGNMKSTSSAIHTLNGLVIFSTSRSQKCISLSSTESEWYSASSGVCDSLYLHHILCFLTDEDVDPVTLHVDNSAVRMLSLKQGAGRLRHIKGRLLWLQSKVSSHELYIKQIKTIFNVADLNTKALNKDRFHGLLFMLGFVVNGERVGETEFAKLQQRELAKQQIQVISRALHEEISDRGQVISKPSKMNGFAKQVLRVLSAFSLVNGTEALNIPRFATAKISVFFFSRFSDSLIGACLVSSMLFFQLQSVRWMMFLTVLAMSFATATGVPDVSEQDQALSLVQSPIAKYFAVLAFLTGLGSFIWVIMANNSSSGIDRMNLEESAESEQDPELDIEVPEHGEQGANGRFPTGYGGDDEHREVPPTLGSKYPQIFSDPYFRAEAWLVWMFERLQQRVRRGNDVVFSQIRQHTVNQSMQELISGVDSSRHQEILEHVRTMPDLSDDENSPTYGYTEEQIRNELGQAYQAYQVGLAMHHASMEGTGEEDENLESEDSEGTTSVDHRYRHCPLEEASDPEMWMNVNHIYSDDSSSQET